MSGNAEVLREGGSIELGKWTADPPLKDGWYWTVSVRGDISPRRLFLNRGTWSVTIPNGWFTWIDFAKSRGLRWSERIVEPPLEKERL